MNNILPLLVDASGGLSRAVQGAMNENRAVLTAGKKSRAGAPAQVVCITSIPTPRPKFGPFANVPTMASVDTCAPSDLASTIRKIVKEELLRCNEIESSASHDPRGNLCFGNNLSTQQVSTIIDLGKNPPNDISRTTSSSAALPI
ncbi:hypothetical protein HPB50_023760 [Hyalomma asiaticum]|uniref:Uncharacterized protein n=1 Tax=Hyalomma asiaticum TaxID=266040 RepID=A0ACB7RX07_HYAAI|nr:hypothetical protein HPB50_023760 [Hyalomma asiaticum]